MTSFNQDVYVLATQSNLFDELMTSIQYSGLGGKRSSGYGTFELEIVDLPEGLEGLLNNGGNEQLLLTTSLPEDTELVHAMTGARYQLVKRSGFAYSETASQLLRKQDLYKFKGAAFWLISSKARLLT